MLYIDRVITVQSLRSVQIGIGIMYISLPVTAAHVALASYPGSNYTCGHIQCTVTKMATLCRDW